MDVKTTFLHGELEEKIYMKHPESYIQEGQENKMCLLTKSFMDLSSLTGSGTSSSTIL